MGFQVINQFETVFLPLVPQLPKGLIHNDGNDHNIVLDDHEDVIGIIDLGDMTVSPYVVELAVTITYGTPCTPPCMAHSSRHVAALLDKVDPIGLSREMIAGYAAVKPLGATEQALVHLLVCARLSQSVTMGAYSYAMNPANTYLLVTAQPGWSLLERLIAMSTDDVARFNGL